jgi:hypothetical protein
MGTKFQRERLRIEGGKPNFKLLEFSNSWIGIVEWVGLPKVHWVWPDNDILILPGPWRN